MKAIDWASGPGGRKKRIYDAPHTPDDRLLVFDVLDEVARRRLEREHARLNPARITRGINALQTQLITAAADRARAARSGISYTA